MPGTRRRIDPPIQAITLDLDDTLWPIRPTIARAEQALQHWLQQHAPRTARRHSVNSMRALRERISVQHPELAHDYSAQRRLSLEQALHDSGDDITLAEPAFEVFFAARNQVTLYPDAAAALERLAARWPLAALTNGNADLGRIGLAHHFVFQLGAREHGAPKPDPGIFLAACARLSLSPQAVLHVGDDPELDVQGAHRAGLRAAWINRRGVIWEAFRPVPEFTVRNLHELADRLEAA